MTEPNKTQVEKHMHDLFSHAFKSSGDIIHKVLSGSWGQDKYAIDLTKILSFLIKQAGALVSNHSSDLFVAWQDIENEKCIRSHAEEDKYFIFGLHNQGIDNSTYVYSQLQSYKTDVRFIRQYYHKIYALHIQKTALSMNAALADITQTLDYWEYDSPNKQHDLSPLEIYRLNKTLQSMGYSSCKPNDILELTSKDNNACKIIEFYHLFYPYIGKLFTLLKDNMSEKGSELHTQFIDLLHNIEIAVKTQEELADTNSLPYIHITGNTISSDDSVDDAVAKWFQGKTAGSFSTAEENNSMLLKFILKKLDIKEKPADEFVKNEFADKHQFKQMFKIINQSIDNYKSTVCTDYLSHNGRWKNGDGYDIDLSDILRFLTRQAEKLIPNYNNDTISAVWRDEIEQEKRNRHWGDYELCLYYVFGLHNNGIHREAQIYNQIKDNKTNKNYAREYYNKIYVLCITKSVWNANVRLLDVTDSLEYEEFDTSTE